MTFEADNVRSNTCAFLQNMDHQTSSLLYCLNDHRFVIRPFRKQVMKPSRHHILSKYNSIRFISLSEVDCHAIAQVDNTLTQLLHLGVLHNVIFAFVVWVGDEVYKLALRHAEFVPAKPISAAQV
jgi:hypothetical protein